MLAVLHGVRVGLLADSDRYGRTHGRSCASHVDCAASTGVPGSLSELLMAGSFEKAESAGILEEGSKG